MTSAAHLASAHRTVPKPLNPSDYHVAQSEATDLVAPYQPTAALVSNLSFT